MTITTEEFVSSFHSLEGFTLAEKNKHLSILFNRTRQSLRNTHDEIDFSILQPNSFLEEMFKLKALIYFQSVPEIMTVLKSGNPVHIAKVLNHSDLFLEKAFGNISGEELVQHIFPCMSFNTKIKLLHKLCYCLRDCKRAEDYFDAIFKSYGLHLAANLIPCCGSNFIIQCIKTNRVELTSAQLLIIAKKFPEIIQDIFDIFNEYNNKITIDKKYKAVFIYLLKNNLLVFLKLNERYQSEFQLGRRATKCLINENKTNAITNSRMIYKLLNKQEAVRSLKEDFKKFYYNVFPKTVSQCKEEYKQILSLLKYMPGDTSRVNLFLTFFKEIYGSDLWKYSEFITPQLLALMTPDHREIWMKNYQKPNRISKELWISFMKTEKSLPLLKEQLSVATSLKMRAKIVPYLVITCNVNNDKLALTHCCEYMVIQRCNENYVVRQGFLNAIIKHYGLHKLKEEQWLHINTLLEYSFINNEHYSQSPTILKAFIEFRLEHDQPVETQLLQWTKCGYGRLDFNKSKHQQHVLIMLSTLVGDTCEGMPPFCKCREYFKCLIKWNKSHPQHRISILSYTKATRCLKLSLEQNCYITDIEEILEEYIRCSSIKYLEECGILRIYFKNKDKMDELLKWFLINKLQYVVDNITSLTKYFLQTYSKDTLRLFYIHLRNYAHTGILQQISDVCKTVLVETDELYDQIINMRWNPDKVGCSIAALSFLMNPNDFVNFITFYEPSHSHIDIHTREGRHIRNIQKSIISSLKNILPDLAFENVLNFSKAGNYPEVIEKTLSLITHDVPEERILLKLNEFLTAETLIQKHAISLMFKLTNRLKIYAMLAEFLKINKNSTVFKYLFKGTFNYFVKNPDDHLWNLLKQIVQNLDVDDNEAFYILLKWNKIPKSYLVPYILFIWDILQNFLNSGVVKERKCELLNAITLEIIPLLPSEFALSVIENYLFKSDNFDMLQSQINLFACNYLIYCSSAVTQDECLKLILDIVNNYIKCTWYNSDTCINGSVLVYNYVQEFCLIFLEKKCADTTIFQKFFKMWNAILIPETALIIFLFVQFTSICLKCTTVNETAKELLLLYDFLLDKYGFVIIDSFKLILGMFVTPYLLNDVLGEAEENIYVLIENILKQNDSPNSLILVISLLPDDAPSTPKIKEKYSDVINSLMKVRNSSVQLCLSEYLMNKA